jgi:hypothetical protein
MAVAAAAKAALSGIVCVGGDCGGCGVRGLHVCMCGELGVNGVAASWHVLSALARIML